MHQTPNPRLMANILPNNATNLEHALASMSHRILDLDTDEIRRLWDPWRCRADLLPYLAWALSVDLWYDDWNEYKKRSVIANAIKHHSQKGTLALLETYADLVGSRVVSAVVPPAKIFSGASLSREQREAWLSRLPQVRVWREYERGQAGHRLFLGGGKWPSFLNAGPDPGVGGVPVGLLMGLTGSRPARHPAGYHKHFPCPNDAITRLRRRARWVVDGQETDARVDNFESYFRVHKKGHLPHSFFAGPALSRIVRKRRFLVPSTAHERVITIEPRPVSAWRSSIGPSLRPVTSEPEIVAVRSHEGRAVYSDRCIGGRYLQPSTAQFRLFERYAVNDGSLIAKRRPTVQFMGVGRYGIRPKSAELKVAIRGRRKPWQAGEGILGRRPVFWMPHNGEPLERTRNALIAAKRRTDTIMLDTSTKPGFIAGLPFWAGDPFIA